ncbi:MAG: hypothetical protein SYC29_06450 [Planctomycetota bacterium]|nr:hypothetical protein [Planctomycetota bacterium]
MVGLDGVELVMEWEEAFGIEIPDDAASRVRTVGEVVDLIHAQLRTRKARDEYCRTSRAFYDLRRSLCPLMGLPRRAIAPKTRLSEIIPKKRRKEVWRDLARAGFSVPPLSPPYGTDGWAGLVVLVLAVALWAVTGSGWMLFSVGPLGVLAWLATRPFAQRVPVECPTAGDLAFRMSPRYGDGADAPGRLPRSEISRRVRMIVAEQLALPVEGVREASRFVDDLQLDR